MTPAQELIQGYLRPLDELAAEMERVWGVGRLPRLVDPEMGRAFISQQQKLNAAIWSGAPSEVEREAARMTTAWRVLDAKAKELGAKPIDPLLWEIVDPQSGRLIARLVRTIEEQRAVARSGGFNDGIPLWSVYEVANIIVNIPQIGGIKEAFPEAVVVSSKPPVDWDRGDDLPPDMGPMAAG